MESGVYQFSNEANKKINDRLKNLLTGILEVVEEESIHQNIKDPNWIIINSQTLTLSVIQHIVTKVNEFNVNYAKAVVKDLNKKGESRPGYGG